jgi:hypothetical protein
MKLKVKDQIKSNKFKYVRSFSGSTTDQCGFMFDYNNYYYNSDGSWNKSVIPREEMGGIIVDNESNSDAIFEIISVTTTEQTMIHNDVVDSYHIYQVKKIDDPKYPIITFADDGIDNRYFPMEHITKIN